MSSHHIVREKQEPALLLINIDNFDDEHLGQLLEWSPTVITTSLTAEQVHAFGIKVDVCITNDADNLQQSDIKLIPKTGDDVVISALEFLVAEGYPSVNVVTDKADPSQLLAYVNRINIVVYTANEKIFPVHSGFSKWKAKDEKVRLLEQPEELVVQGLELTGNNAYCTIADGFYSMVFNGDVLFIAEAI